MIYIRWTSALILSIEFMQLHMNTDSRSMPTSPLNTTKMPHTFRVMICFEVMPAFSSVNTAWTEATQSCRVQPLSSVVLCQQWYSVNSGTLSTNTLSTEARNAVKSSFIIGWKLNVILIGRVWVPQSWPLLFHQVQVALHAPTSEHHCFWYNAVLYYATMCPTWSHLVMAQGRDGAQQRF